MNTSRRGGGNLPQQNLEGGAIYVSASEVALNCCILPILKKYRTLYPKVKIRISNHSTPQAITALKEGLADLAIVTTPTVKSTTLTEKKIKTIREVAVCGNGFPELLFRKVTLKELSEYPIISLGTDTKTFEMYFGLLHKKTVSNSCRTLRRPPPTKFFPWFVPTSV